MFGISGQSQNWFHSYLNNRNQATLVNGTLSDYAPVTCGVPQGSILGPLLFIMYINDLPAHIKNCNVALYADDTALYFSANDPAEMKKVLNDELENVSKWFILNKLTLNTKKTKYMIFGSVKKVQKIGDIGVSIGGDSLEKVNVFKYLGMWLDSTLSFRDHIDYICKKASSKIGVLGKIRKFVSQEIALMLYKALVLPHFDYADTVWDTAGTIKGQLQILQNRALRIVLRGAPGWDAAVEEGYSRLPRTTWLHETTKLAPLQERRDFHLATLMYKNFNGLVPGYISSKFSLVSSQHTYSTRFSTNNNVFIPSRSLNYGKQAISYRGAKAWNDVDPGCRQAPTLDIFKTKYWSSGVT